MYQQCILASMLTFYAQVTAISRLKRAPNMTLSLVHPIKEPVKHILHIYRNSFSKNNVKLDFINFSYINQI